MSVRPSVRAFLPACEHDILKRFCCKLAQVVNEDETINFGGQVVTRYRRTRRLLSSKFLASVTQYAPLLRSLFRRLSVCPTVMGVNCEKTEEFLQNLFAPTGRPGIWLGREKIARKYSQPSPPPGGQSLLCRKSMKNYQYLALSQK